MDGKKIDRVIVDEVPEEPAVDEKWIKLVAKLANQPKNRNLILLPEEVQMITSKFRDLTAQLLNTMQFINKYAPLMKQISEVAARVEAAGGTEDDSTSSESGDADSAARPSTDAVRSGHREVVGSDDGVDPEDLHNTLTPE